MRALLLFVLSAPLAMAGSKAPAAKPATMLDRPFHVVSALATPSVTGKDNRLVKLYSVKMDCEPASLPEGMQVVLANVRWETGHTFDVPVPDGSTDSLYFWDEGADDTLVYATKGRVTVIKAPTKPGEIGRVRIEGVGPDKANAVPPMEVDVTVCAGW
jgi:hypothetical protein